MIHSETQLSLSIISDAEPSAPFRVQLSADGTPLATEKKVVEKRYRQIHHLADACRQLLKSGGNPDLAADTLTSAGTELFDAWLAPFWSQAETVLASNPAQPCHITVTSNVMEVLFLPWELLQFPDGVMPGLDRRFALRRLPKNVAQANRCCPTLPPGPLKVLFMASAPTNSGELDFEAEERALRQSLQNIDAEIALEVADSGTLAELKAYIHQFQPHIVHLSGPALIKNETGYFAFEDDIGNADIRSATELSNELFKHSGVHGIILSGRDGQRPSPVAALGAVAQELAINGTPLVLAWGETLTNTTAGSFAKILYSALAAGHSMDQALSKARRGVLKECETSGYPSWILPMLFATTNQSRVFNNSPTAPRIRPVPLTNDLPPLPGLNVGAVHNHRMQRRSIQRLLPQLLDGSLHTLLLTGIEGSGKSTLASHLAQNLERAGFNLIAISGTATTPLTTARILSTFEKTLLQQGLADEREILLNPRISMEDRLGFIAALMNRHTAYVLVLDGLQWSLDPQHNRFYDPTMAPFFFYMLDQMNGKSRFIATSRVTPVSGGPAPLPATCREEKLLEPFVSLLPKPQELDADNQNSLSRAALYNLPTPMEGIAAVLDKTPKQTQKILEFWQSQGLAFKDDHNDIPVWHINRPLPEGLATLDAETTKKCQQAAGHYLLTHLQTSDIGPLQRSWLDVAVQTVEHFLLAEDYLKAIEVVEPINIYLDHVGFYWEKEQLNGKIYSRYKHPHPLYRIAVAQQRQGQLQKARTSLEEVLRMTKGRVVNEEALALFDLASLDLQKGSIADAMTNFKASLRINRKLNDGKGIVACLTQIGMINMHDGDMEQALSPMEEALEIQRISGSQAEIAQLLPWIGDIYFRLGETSNARKMFQEVLPILKEHKDTTMEAQILHQLATLDLNTGEHLSSLKGFLSSLTIKRDLNDHKGKAATFFQLGRLAKAVGHQDSCMRFIGLCYRIDNEVGNPDAEHERKIFDEIVETIGIDDETANTVLEDVWAEYNLDGGQGLIDKTFKKLLQQKKIIPINVA